MASSTWPVPTAPTEKTSLGEFQPPLSNFGDFDEKNPRRNHFSTDLQQRIFNDGLSYSHYPPTSTGLDLFFFCKALVSAAHMSGAPSARSRGMSASGSTVNFTGYESEPMKKQTSASAIPRSFFAIIMYQKECNFCLF